MRRAALDVLGHAAEHHGQPLSPAIGARATALTEDEDAEVRAEACASLALLPAQAAELPDRVRALVSRLADDNAEVRQEAAAALGDLPSIGAEVKTADRDRLAERLEDGDVRVRFEAAFALASLSDARARAPLETWLGDRRRRMDALEALARLGDPAALPSVTRLGSKWILPWADRLTALACRVRLEDARARPQIAERLHARRFEERVYACALVGQLGIAEALESLRRLAEKPAEPARDAAIEALGVVGEAQDLRRFEGWLEDSDADAETQELIREAANALIARGIRDPSAS